MKKNAKILKNNLKKNFKGATGGINKKLLSAIRLRHSKKQSSMLLNPLTLYKFFKRKTIAIDLLKFLEKNV